jgi:hypothetical protein
VYRASHDDYEESFLPTGVMRGSPEEGWIVRAACIWAIPRRGLLIWVEGLGGGCQWRPDRGRPCARGVGPGRPG